eukprot:scaffold2094_cov239-Pinguiococcus_pyrenoidosus.AAC.4
MIVHINGTHGTSSCSSYDQIPCFECRYSRAGSRIPEFFPALSEQLDDSREKAFARRLLDVSLSSSPESSTNIRRRAQAVSRGNCLSTEMDADVETVWTATRFDLADGFVKDKSRYGKRMTTFARFHGIFCVKAGDLQSGKCYWQCGVCALDGRTSLIDVTHATSRAVEHLSSTHSILDGDSNARKRKKDELDVRRDEIARRASPRSACLLFTKFRVRAGISFAACESQEARDFLALIPSWPSEPVTRKLGRANSFPHQKARQDDRSCRTGLPGP